MGVMFDYTQKSFWGGSWYPYWSLIIISIIGGLFGLDHFWLRSPLTGTLKFFVNIFSLGLWYFYDLVQILGEKESVMKNGLSAPIIGPLGIGAGMFRDNNPNEPLAKAPYKFLAYLILAFLPFGFEFFLAGDSNGAMAKFICTIIFFLWPIAIIWSVVNVGRTLFMPKSLFTNGTLRMFPIDWFMDETGPSVLGPVDIVDKTDVCGERSSGGFIGRIITNSLQSVIGVIAPGLVPAIGAVTGATHAVASGVTETATTASQSAQELIRAATIPAVATMSTVGSTMAEIPAALNALPAVGHQVTDKLGAMTTAEGLHKLAQKGGSGSSSSSSSEFSSYGLLLLFTILLGGGTLMAVRRMSLKNSSSVKKDATDTPPES